MLVGGSCGSAVAGAIKALKGARPEDVAVVILPDTGSRYLSTLYNDEWMRDNGFLEPAMVQVKTLLRGKSASMPGLASVLPSQTVRDAIALVREHDISFIPVIEGGRVLGTLYENHLMRAVLEDPAVLDQQSDTVMKPSLSTLSPEESVQAAIRHMGRENPAVIVVDEGKPVGILTRTDVIGFISQ